MRPLIIALFLLSVNFSSYSSPVLVRGDKLNLKIHGMDGYQSEDEKSFFKQAMVLLLKVVESEEFKENFSKRGAGYRQGMSKEEVVDFIRSGWCQKFREKDNTLDLHTVLYPGGRYRNSVGHTGGYLYIKTNRRFFSSWFSSRDYCPVVSHILHEYTHLASFIHPRSSRSSVPYQAGYAAREVCYKMLESVERESFLNFAPVDICGE